MTLQTTSVFLKIWKFETYSRETYALFDLQSFFGVKAQTETHNACSRVLCVYILARPALEHSRQVKKEPCCDKAI